MRGWAKLVLAELPDGPIELLSTSTEGCALAAVVAATREAGPTRWRRLDLGLNDESTDGYRAVVVEAVELGAGLRAAISAALPDALVMSGIGLRRGLIAA